MTSPADEADEAAASFHILVVCTANRCRSAAGEALFRAAIGDRNLPVSVSSAGTAARDGLSMHPEIANVLSWWGMDVAAFRSRRVTHDMLAEADLILTATEAHRTSVARIQPASIGRTFVLLQFADLVRRSHSGGLASASPEELLSTVRQAQSSLQPPTPGAYDLADPIGRAARQYSACVESVARAVETVMGH